MSTCASPEVDQKFYSVPAQGFALGPAKFKILVTLSCIISAKVMQGMGTATAQHAAFDHAMPDNLQACSMAAWLHDTRN